LVKEDYRRVAERRDVAGRYFHGQALAGSVAEPPHDFLSFLTVLGHIGAITGQRVQDLGWHAPHTFRWRQHDAPDIALSFGDDVDEGLAVEAQRHRPAQVRVIEGCRIRVDDQVAPDIRRV